MSLTRRSAFGLATAAHLVLICTLAAGAYAGALPTSLPAWPHADLLGHALFIGLLAPLLDGALDRWAPFPRAPWLHLAPLLVLAAAGVEEWAQRFSPRRTSCWSDFAADVVGVVLFTALGCVISPREGRTARARAGA